jgi:hypothetical protein
VIAGNALTETGGTTPTSAWPTLATFTSHHLTAVTGALVVAALLLALAIRWITRGGYLAKTVSVITWIAAYGFSAEGMWVVVTGKAHVPPLVAVGVFFVGEAMQVNSMILASRRYARDGHPGKHGRAVWIIAVVMGAVVMFAATNWAERLLRLSIPLGTALLWWNTLTDDGCVKRPTRFRWTPTRLLEWLGALEPDVDRDLDEVARQRQIAAMVTARLGYEAGGWVGSWHGRRLRALAKTADKAMVVEVRKQVSRALRIVELTVPVVAEVPVDVPPTGAPEVPVVVPVGVPPEVPVAPSGRRSAGTSTRKVGRKKPEPKKRRSADETRKLAAELQLADPALTQAQIAAQLQISDRRLREVLAEPAKTNGHTQPDLLPTGSQS